MVSHLLTQRQKATWKWPIHDKCWLSCGLERPTFPDATHLLVTYFSIRSYCHAAPLFQSWGPLFRLSVYSLLSQSCELLREVRGASKLRDQMCGTGPKFKTTVSTGDWAQHWFSMTSLILLLKSPLGIVLCLL